MNAIQLISKHLSRQHLDSSKIHAGLENIVCAFSGEQLTEGIKLKDLLSGKFNDFEYLKYDSKYAGVGYALCLKDCYENGDKIAGLRNFSYFASESKLVILKSNDVYNFIASLKEHLCNDAHFVLCVTFSSKKHLSIKAKLNGSNTDEFDIETDKFGRVKFIREQVNIFYSIIKGWYSSNSASDLHTYFTKEEILGYKEPYFNKILEYGEDKFFEESLILNRFRGSNLFEFLVSILQKTQYENQL